MAEFSQRVEQIEASKDDLIEAFVADHGRRPTGVEIVRLRQQATIATRPAKTHRSLAEMTEHWRRRAGDLDGRYGEEAWVASLRDRNDLPLLAAGDLAEPILDDAARAVGVAVAERRATYRRDNLLDEAHRLLHGVRFASPDDRVTVAEQIADLAVDASLALTPPPVASHARALSPPRRIVAAASRSHRIYTTRDLARCRGPSPRERTTKRWTDGHDRHRGRHHRAQLARTRPSPVGRPGRRGGEDRHLQTVDRRAGGTGRDRQVHHPGGLKAVWEAEHGTGSVIGLAPSAAAAEVLAGELGIGTDNTAKWLTEHRKSPTRNDERQRIAAVLAAHPDSANAERLRERLHSVDAEIARWRLQPGQLLIIDEAGLAGTFALDELVRAAGDAGAKVLLSGDWAQQGSVEAGGAFGLLARDETTSVAELGEVHRFSSEWERAASIELRHGNESALDTYESHDRITGGTREELLEAVYLAWKHDIDTGSSSLMIAPDTATVAELNRRARADRIAAGKSPKTV